MSSLESPFETGPHAAQNRQKAPTTIIANRIHPSYGHGTLIGEPLSKLADTLRRRDERNWTPARVACFHSRPSDPLPKIELEGQWASAGCLRTGLCGKCKWSDHGDSAQRAIGQRTAA